MAAAGVTTHSGEATATTSPLAEEGKGSLGMGPLRVGLCLPRVVSRLRGVSSIRVRRPRIRG